MKTNIYNNGELIKTLESGVSGYIEINSERIYTIPKNLLGIIMYLTIGLGFIISTVTNIHFLLNLVCYTPTYILLMVTIKLAIKNK